MIFTDLTTKSKCIQKVPILTVYSKWPLKKFLKILIGVFKAHLHTGFKSPGHAISIGNLLSPQSAIISGNNYLSHVYIGEDYTITLVTVTVTIYLPWPSWAMQYR